MYRAKHLGSPTVDVTLARIEAGRLVPIDATGFSALPTPQPLASQR
jgi:hypothetical protein